MMMQPHPSAPSHNTKTAKPPNTLRGFCFDMPSHVHRFLTTSEIVRKILYPMPDKYRPIRRHQRVRGEYTFPVCICPSISKPHTCSIFPR